MRDNTRAPDRNRVSGFVKNRGNPLKLIGEQTIAEYRRSDASLDFAVSTVTVSCKKGCAACCKQLVSTSLAEACAIATAHPKKLLQKRKKIEEQVELFASISRSVFGDETSLNVDSEEALAEFAKKNDRLADLWWDAKVSCVFLRDDNTCSVYDVRPISCRGYYVRTDPALCHKNDKTDVEMYDFNAIRYLRLRLLENQPSLDFTMMYLPVALQLVIKKL
jgi:Fe-S-cluster containining protein